MLIHIEAALNELLNSRVHIILLKVSFQGVVRT